MGTIADEAKIPRPDDPAVGPILMHIVSFNGTHDRFLL